jgi:DNA polymerase-3 subunit epsilon
MRRRYPGHESYSLGNLTDIYGIDLKDHHRALCDARAAAHLLNLINEKRGNEPKEDGIAA